MLSLQGYGASPGVGDGILHLYVNSRQTPKPYTVKDVPAEEARLNDALEQLSAEIKQLRTHALEQGLSDEESAGFVLQQEILEDNDFLTALRTAVLERHLCAEYAVHSTAKAYALHLRTLDDPYLHARSNDALDLGRRLVALLAGEPENPLKDVTARVILAADLLLPEQTIYLARDKVAAFIMRDGAQYTQTAILMRSLGIPMVTGLGQSFDKLQHGKRTMVDGESGTVVQDPCAETLTDMAQKMLQSVREERRMQMCKGQPAVTQSGVRIQLTANIALPQEVKRAIDNDAEGIGLFRSELLYACTSDAQMDEDELYRIYRETLLMMGGKRVVVRTLDHGSDKSLYCSDQPIEENPALGFRAIPLGLQSEKYLRPQLRAMARASAYGDLALLLPMIVDAQEIRDVKALLNRVRRELRKEGKMTSERIQVGAMIETPAAAMTVDLIAQEADFISIGTNDLTQYVMVSDRKNPRVSVTYDERHPAVMRMVASTVYAAQAAGIPVCICGEAAADPALAPVFAALRVDELSMSPISLLKIKRRLRELTAEDCKQALKDALQFATKK